MSDENATAAFEELRASIQANTTAYRERFAARMGRTVRAAENATGREMAVQNVTVETSREELTAYGVVTYRFRWTGFAAVSGDRMLVGDALDALYLDRQTTLVLSWPASYRASAVKPAADRKHDGSVAWVGPSSFESGEPRLVLEPARPTASGTPSSTAGTPADGSGSRGGFPIGGAALGGAVLVVGLGAGATMWFISRRGGTRATIPDSGTAAPTSDDESLMTPSEQVLALLRTEGGRMKQARVAERLDWTAAKTSRVVSDLREAGEVETFRVGRENVIALSEE